MQFPKQRYRRRFRLNNLEDCAHSLIEFQSETVFLRKLLDLRFSIFFVERPEALQVRLVNSAMLPFAELQFAFDLACERFLKKGVTIGFCPIRQSAISPIVCFH
jgi:hypothetical protein